MKKQEKHYRKLLLEALAQEIEWCKKNRGAEEDKKFEEGFMEGLKQAERFAKKIKQFE